MFWAELRWAAHAEGVVHLDDLLLRRVRLDMLTARGGLPIMKKLDRGLGQDREEIKDRVTEAVHEIRGTSEARVFPAAPIGIRYYYAPPGGLDD